MKVVGLETIIFGVDDIPSCAIFLTDYGLIPVDVTDEGGRFEALDGTGVVLAKTEDPSLPASVGNGCMMRKTVMGVADQQSLDDLYAELSKDRAVETLADGSIESHDDSGFAIGFQISKKKQINLVGEISNLPGSPFQRPVNQLGVDVDAEQIRPISLSHIVYFVPDVKKAEAFYVERLGFRCTDRFEDIGPFLQPSGSLEHHTHFLIGAPPFMQGVEHFTFHFSGPTELIQNGERFIKKGYQAFWGPGRHILGSNWFWYFNSPFACHIEMDADMDLHDKNWTPRVSPMGADASQAFLMRNREKWAPGADTPHNGDYE
ncbi:Catechol 2,3-dioxygenase-like lactoylglutathione lyase family enzyme [Alteromonas sp. 38]|uniref:VOC family protein n=1 Tax=Alteromonas TaxID=226 RepID=UPI0012F376C4|nr:MULTISPECIES: VOC family protein [Alteromonas]CAD5274250.1 Catechol 2,3-dioxygenase-like lactoylglutathione lyase family enzyme [Alteromonas sp. 154]VXB60039.1 Catechol 2,3-dioxygenase-like lactoylglutathione lyase family enzyme [Alteromonas sp. 38]